MNVEEKNVFLFITRSVSDQLNIQSDERLRLFITGNDGNGKTFLFNVLKNYVNRCYSKQVVKVCAYRGGSALSGGSALHSTLKLHVQKDGRIVQMPILTGNYLRLMRQQWQHIEFLFMDEISMVPYEMLCMADS
ncbi:ATP-dependent DNA helicase [Trichonephila inaurata madagascariensis]|uniref:ATP-dependent DNA helicase n=1 Tax=Trichonephila inaurata madagascariensis TaxID=2747483 RepID=A0A8X6Y1I2_9ARAC|nr:ATP-dependent DNA helicase [Trichonephila inaurata madagascariensis]